MFHMVTPIKQNEDCIYPYSAVVREIKAGRITCVERLRDFTNQLTDPNDPDRRLVVLNQLAIQKFRSLIAKVNSARN